jgi:hypothetical protein
MLASDFLEPPDDDDLPYTLQACPVPQAEGSEGGIDLTTPPPGATIRCILQRAVSSGPETSDGREPTTPYGVSVYNVITKVDPGVTAAMQEIRITGDLRTPTYPAPLVLSSRGPAEPPAGLAWRWTVTCEMKG